MDKPVDVRIRASGDPFWALALRAGLFPAALILAAGGTVWGLSAGIPGMPLQFGAFVGALVVVVAFERLLSEEQRGDRPKRSEWAVDATSFAVLMAVVNPGIELGVPLLFGGLVAAFDLPSTLNLFPSHLPLGAQVALALLGAEFGQYWMHRAAHEWPALWRVHASHHSSERIYWLNGFRVHPLNAVWHHLAGVFVLKLAGAPSGVLFICLAIAGVVQVFQHANLRLILGPLNWIFSTNELHRWHHADTPQQGNTNYGGVLIVWDLLFGTYLRRPGQRPERYGLFPGNESYPRHSWLGQMVAPFAWPAGAAKSERQLTEAR
jgi:sterol desaturase/sphingolipid hydroxylase (fatty acid hydroxylase superfamily)